MESTWTQLTLWDYCARGLGDGRNYPAPACLFAAEKYANG